MFWLSTRPEGNILALSSRTLTFSLLPLNTPNKNTASAPLVVSHGIRYEGSASHACTVINSLGDGYEMHRPSLFFSLPSSRQLPGYKRSAVMHSKPSVSLWWLPHSPFGVLFVILSPLCSVREDIGSLYNCVSRIERWFSAYFAYFVV